jgi:alpha-L-rhamnosidase
MRDGFVFVPANTVVNAHYVGALHRYADLVEAAGDAAAAAAARANATSLAAAMRAQLFNASVGAFADGLGAHHAAIHSTAYAVARGVADGDDAIGAAAFATLVARLSGDGGIPVGPYPGMHYAEALFRNTSDHGNVGVAQFLLANGTNSWLNQLRQGATTTMESWTVAEKSNLTWRCVAR